MSVSNKLASLFRSIAHEDLESVRTIAQEICDVEEQKGHTNVAKSLRGALLASKKGFANSSTPALSALETSQWTTGLARLSENKGLNQVSLAPTSRKLIDEIILEFKFKKSLADHQLAHRSKLILHGPSGCGKSLTASAIANELNIPVYMVRFDEIIGAYLGQTASKLREIFSFIENTKCVLLLDEIDAIGRRRGDARDVGELDRIVISLMQELEYARPQGVIIATTNIPEELDRALWRRFDVAIEFTQPSKTQLRSFGKKIAASRNASLSKSVFDLASETQNYAECERVVINQIRRDFLSEQVDDHGKK